MYLCWCKSLTPAGQRCVGGGGLIQWEVGTDERKSHHKFSSGQTNENSLIHGLAHSILFGHECKLAFVFQKPHPDPGPLSPCGRHPKTIPIKPRPLLNPSFFPISSQMTNNMTSVQKFRFILSGVTLQPFHIGKK